MNTRTFLLLVFLSNCFISLKGQGPTSGIRKSTLAYSKKDTTELKLDLYTNAKSHTHQPCMIFIFGGGFIKGKRDHKVYEAYFERLVKENYKVVSIDYRLGLKGEKWPTIFNTSGLKNAISLAVEDLYDATSYLLKNAEKLGIDTSMIILSGSSAGAITALHGDWEKRNSMPSAAQLPAHFQYKGVISFAGAIFSYLGKPTYKIPPAPTMMFHGTEDKLVVYDKKQLFNRGMFGSSFLAKTFKKNKYPYYIHRVAGAGHEIAGTPMTKNLDDIVHFIHTYIQDKRHYQTEVNALEP